MNNNPTPVEVRAISWWPPSWIVRTVFMALGLGGLGIAVAWYEVSDARHDARAECRQAVEFRRETRAMWLELFAAFPQSAVETGLRDDLENLLPPLRCDGTEPVPDIGGTP
jgi:hypothetical protein